MTPGPDPLRLDNGQAIDAIAERIREIVRSTFHKRGAVVAVSGGIDSAVCAALAVRALGKQNVLLLFLPDRDSSPESLALGRELAGVLGAESIVEDITPILSGFGCYARQAEAIRMVFPVFQEGWKFKVVLPPLLEGERLSLSRLVVEKPDGEQWSGRLPHAAYLQLIAATNFKQRSRKMLEYYHADRLNYAVCGTPNRLEYDQGFFVKGGDGLADFKPIAHLYKTQVFSLARTLGVPEGIWKRTPTTDTFPLAQTQEEFYFSISYDKLDLCLWSHNHGVSAAEAGALTGLTEEQVRRVFADIEAKRRTTHPLHLHSVLIEPVPEIERAAGGIHPRP